MRSSADPGGALARRLRALRVEHWPGRRISQPQLAEVLGVSPPLVSGWESLTSPKVPPVDRLDAYATFFATERSVEREPYRLLDLDQLTHEERDRYESLLAELTDLREAERGESSAEAGEVAEPNSLLHFPDGLDVTIVCTELPPDLRAMPYANLNSPDYGQLYTLADPDALLELHGHIRALNPRNQVNIRRSIDMGPDDYTTHLVLLGGVDWNLVTRDLLARADAPVVQRRRADGESTTSATLEAKVGGDSLVFSPTISDFYGERVLIEDVAHIYRNTNPYNALRTVTLFNGMCARGTYGAVRALTDSKFRSRNEAYIRDRFASREHFSVITRVVVANSEVVTPDWTVPENVLHEWP